jgi:hypothetical protein
MFELVFEIDTVLEIAVRGVLIIDTLLLLLVLGLLLLLIIVHYNLIIKLIEYALVVEITGDRLFN